MPANGTNGQGVGMTDDEIWQIITYIAAGSEGHGQNDRDRPMVKSCSTAMELWDVPHGRSSGRWGGSDDVGDPARRGSHRFNTQSDRRLLGIDRGTKDSLTVRKRHCGQAAETVQGVTLNEDSFSVKSWIPASTSICSRKTN